MILEPGLCLFVIKHRNSLSLGSRFFTVYGLAYPGPPPKPSYLVDQTSGSHSALIILFPHPLLFFRDSFLRSRTVPLVSLFWEEVPGRAPSPCDPGPCALRDDVHLSF